MQEAAISNLYGFGLHLPPQAEDEKPNVHSVEYPDFFKPGPHDEQSVEAEEKFSLDEELIQKFTENINQVSRRFVAEHHAQRSLFEEQPQIFRRSQPSTRFRELLVTRKNDVIQLITTTFISMAGGVFLTAMMGVSYLSVLALFGILLGVAANVVFSYFAYRTTNIFIRGGYTLVSAIFFAEAIYLTAGLIHL